MGNTKMTAEYPRAGLVDARETLEFLLWWVSETQHRAERRARIQDLPASPPTRKPKSVNTAAAEATTQGVLDSWLTLATSAANATAAVVGEMLSSAPEWTRWLSIFPLPHIRNLPIARWLVNDGGIQASPRITRLTDVRFPAPRANSARSAHRALSCVRAFPIRLCGRSRNSCRGLRLWDLSLTLSSRGKRGYRETLTEIL